VKVSDYFRNHRKELGLTQQQLADKAGVSLSCVKRFEANKPYNPFGTTIHKCCTILEADTTFVILELQWPK